jgi:hypothetical protein
VTRRLARAIATLLIAAVFACATGSAQSRTAAPRAPVDEFFIISSIDVDRNQLLLKRPTEVTEVMRVDGATRYVDEDKKPIKVTDLRAGDTVYITSRPGIGGSLAVEIRKGPMTVIELRRRYFR